MRRTVLYNGRIATPGGFVRGMATDGQRIALLGSSEEVLALRARFAEHSPHRLQSFVKSAHLTEAVGKVVEREMGCVVTGRVESFLVPFDGADILGLGFVGAAHVVVCISRLVESGRVESLLVALDGQVVVGLLTMEGS